MESIESFVDGLLAGDGDQVKRARYITEFAARDAAIRAESAELLRVCGEALDETTRQLEAMNRSVAHAASWIEPISNSTTVRIHKNKATLAALKDAGVME